MICAGLRSHDGGKRVHLVATDKGIGMKRLIVTGLAVIGFSGLALARPLEGELPPGGTACWSRAYDASHLARHPYQRVAAIALSKQADEPGRGVLALTLKINLRERTKPGEGEVRHYDYSHLAFCRPSGAALVCENEYGLGAFRVERARGGLLVRNPGSVTFNPSNHDSEDVSDDAVTIPARPDDGAWLLDMSGVRECPF